MLKPGRTLPLCDIEVFVEKGGREKLCAKLLQPMMRLDGRADLPAG